MKHGAFPAIQDVPDNENYRKRGKEGNHKPVILLQIDDDRDYSDIPR